MAVYIVEEPGGTVSTWFIQSDLPELAVLEILHARDLYLVAVAPSLRFLHADEDASRLSDVLWPYAFTQGASAEDLWAAATIAVLRTLHTDWRAREVQPDELLAFEAECRRRGYASLLES